LLNQISVRGTCDPQVTANRLREPAINVLVHDNLIRNCGTGLATDTGQARVGEVIDPTTFVCGDGNVPMERRRSHCYRGYHLVWTSGGKLHGPVTVERFDPETLSFQLREPAALQTGDLFEVYPPEANWSIHHNTIASCQKPVVLEAWGSPTSTLRENLLECGAVPDVKTAIWLRGRFNILDNHFSGFEEPAAVLMLPNRMGKTYSGIMRGNIFE
jgi:hypothetical protein